MLICGLVIDVVVVSCRCCMFLFNFVVLPLAGVGLSFFICAILAIVSFYFLVVYIFYELFYFFFDFSPCVCMCAYVRVYDYTKCTQTPYFVVGVVLRTLLVVAYYYNFTVCLWFCTFCLFCCILLQYSTLPPRPS